MLTLPDLRQRDGFSCGPTSAAIVLQHLGRTSPRSFPSCSPVDGTDPLALVPVFRRAGLAVQSGEMSIADLRHHTRQGRPVVCLVQMDGSYGHYVVVGGVWRRRVYYQCPTRGPWSESATVFASRWWDMGRDVKYYHFGIAVGELA